jgi:hypothetical protein
MIKADTRVSAFSLDEVIRKVLIILIPIKKRSPIAAFFRVLLAHGAAPGGLPEGKPVL